MNDMAIDVEPHRFTVADFRHLVGAGIVADDARVELLDGLIVAMAPIGFAHARHHALAVAHLTRRLGDAAFVVGPGSFASGERDMPEPDIAVLEGGWARASGEPDLTALLAVVEIAQSSLALDLGRKARLYARALIPDYVVVDVDRARLVHHERPANGSYAAVTVRDAAARFALTRFPEQVLDAAAFFDRGRAGS